MKWILNRKLKLGAACLLVFFCSFSVYGQGRELSEAEKAEPADLTKGELQAIFQELDNSQAENESWEKKYDELNQKYLTALTAHETELMKYEQKYKLMEIESQVREESLNKYASETILTDIGIFAAGMCFGGWLDGYIRDWTEYNQTITAGE